MIQNGRPASSFSNANKNKKKKNLFVASSKSDRKKHNGVSQTSAGTAVSFVQGNVSDSQFWSGNDQNIQSLIETMINTKTLLHLKNCPLLYHIVALPNLIHQLEEKKQNNPQLVFTTSDSLQI